ncbi:hypothetical protein AMECASPLE_030972, partial [Ameca splendens]
ALISKLPRYFHYVPAEDNEITSAKWRSLSGFLWQAGLCEITLVDFMLLKVELAGLPEGVEIELRIFTRPWNDQKLSEWSVVQLKNASLMFYFSGFTVGCFITVEMCVLPQFLVHIN